MNLIDALNSGRRIRRPGWGYWIDNSDDDFCLAIADVVADDWEILETPITITKSQFLEHLRSALEAEMLSSNLTYVGDPTEEFKAGSYKHLIDALFPEDLGGKDAD